MTDERKDHFTALVSQRQQGLWRLALMMLRNEQDAEDAVAQGMENCWRKINHIRRKEALSAYLTRCVMNASRDILRKRGRETVTDSMELFMPPEKTQTPVWMYLSALDDTYRIPLMLRFSENLPNTEIAKIMHLPAGTVSSRIARGLQLLRNQIEKEEKSHD